ncbi:Uri superfamily endonuclease [Xanthomonas sp. 3376]|uniref:Uncharacterized protein n=1 Tax=Xanthomonas arboricola TaxID=56448 RepID=A0AAU9I2U3_9XANT|nr:Uri superfamily endonuclease [Xanthomonas arboricola]CAE6688245.1 hypothetical protein XA1314C_01080 [Xanthomonas arboricola]CAE6688257.1 hypothetical protein XA1314C_01080 [Xanthomonas arboricola]
MSGLRGLSAIVHERSAGHRVRCLLQGGLAAKRLICGLVAWPLPAHHRRTRRKYVLVGSYAASMPRKVPRRWAGKDLSRWSARMVFDKATDGLSGAVSSPRSRRCGFVAGPLPAHHRGTRRKYVLVGSYAASMPRKVPRRWADKDLSRWSVCVVLNKATNQLFGEGTALATDQVLSAQGARGVDHVDAIEARRGRPVRDR